MLFGQKKSIVLVLLVFFIFGLVIIIITPVFDAPDQLAHFAYILFFVKYNKIPKYIEWGKETENYIDIYYPNVRENKFLFILDNNYSFAYSGRKSVTYNSLAHHPPLYYFISSILIKKFTKLDKLEKLQVGNSTLNKYVPKYKINEENKEVYVYSVGFKAINSLFLPAYLLKFIQLIFGIFIVYFILKILKLLLIDDFNDYDIFMSSFICLLPSFIFTCTYINNDVLSILLGIISIYFLLLYAQQNRFIFFMISFILSVLSFMTKSYGIFLILIDIIYFIYKIIIKKKKIVIFISLISFLIVLVISLILIIYFFSSGVTANYLKNFITKSIVTTFKDFRILFTKDFFLGFIPKILLNTIAFFDQSHVIADKFLYYFYYPFILAGVIIFFKNLKLLKEKLETFTIIFSIIFLNIIFLLAWAIASDLTGWGGRFILISFILINLFTILGYKNLNIKYYKYFSRIIFILILILNIFNIYQYIYLFYYKDITINYILY